MEIVNSPLLFGKTIDYLERGLAATSLRSKVTANNIANVNVKNFKRGEVIFEEALKREHFGAQMQSIVNPQLKTTDPRHIAHRQANIHKTTEPRIHYDTLSSVRNDGNNVDVENEVVQMLRAQSQYSLYADRIGGKFRFYNSLLRLA